jgi:hypothetical protein
MSFDKLLDTKSYSRIGLLRLSLIRPFQNVGGDNSPRAIQIVLAHLSLKNYPSIISLIFNLELGKYFESPWGYGGLRDVATEGIIDDGWP